MLRVMRDPLRPRLLLLCLALAAGTTWGLFELQSVIESHEHRAVRAYGIGFLFPVLVMTIVGGRWSGRLTLWLSALATVIFLTPPLHSLVINRLRDGVGLILLLAVGEALVRGLDRIRRKMALVEDVEQSPFTISLLRDARDAGAAAAGVAGLGRCAVRRRGLEFFLDMEVFVVGSLSLAEAQDIAQRVDAAVRATYPLIGDVRVRLRPAAAPSLLLETTDGTRL